MATCIQDFVIHDYKGIHELKLDGLNSINILTGDNNSGKTSVLELLSTIGNPCDIGSWILCSRMRNVNIRNRSYFTGFYNMFPIDSDKKEVSYTYTDGYGETNTVILNAEIEQLQISEKEMYELDGLSQLRKSKKDEELVDALAMFLSFYFNGKKQGKNIIYDFQRRSPGLRNRHESHVKTVYMSPVDHATGLPRLNEILSNTKLYGELINILKEFDSDIVGVSALKNDSDPFVSEYMILSEKHEKALPLNAYGDGMKKALFLLSAVLRARNGILLLDEFETAIHTSAMNSVFSCLMKSALKYNVQVFLTSHSKEAIDKILRVDEVLQPYINLYTLYDFDGKNYARRMSCHDAINAQDNLGLELR